MNRNLHQGKRRVAVASMAAFGLVALAACSSSSTSEGEASEAPAAEAPASEAPASEAAAAPVITVGEEGTIDQFIDISAVCGDKPVTVGVVDGIGSLF